MGVEAQFALVYDGRRLALFEGETTLGRALACQIRFNAPSVSREHLRLRVSGGRISCENLSTSVGSLLNGKPLHGNTPLFHGDTLQLGQVEMRIERVDGLPLDGPGRPMADDGMPEEATLPGQLMGDGAAYASVAPAPIDHHTCPECRGRVAIGDPRCGSCGYVWPSAAPGSILRQHTAVNLRLPPPPPTGAPRTVPLVYTSEEMTVDVHVSSLTSKRIFVPSLLLDPVGTACELTLLPDGAHPMTVHGRVVGVRDGAGDDAGMDVALEDAPLIVRVWIDGWVAGEL